jgi:hypothetical protein
VGPPSGFTPQNLGSLPKPGPVGFPGTSSNLGQVPAATPPPATPPPAPTVEDLIAKAITDKKLDSRVPSVGMKIRMKIKSDLGLDKLPTTSQIEAGKSKAGFTGSSEGVKPQAATVTWKKGDTKITELDPDAVPGFRKAADKAQDARTAAKEADKAATPGSIQGGDNYWNIKTSAQAHQKAADAFKESSRIAREAGLPDAGMHEEAAGFHAREAQARHMNADTKASGTPAGVHVSANRGVSDLSEQTPEVKEMMRKRYEEFAARGDVGSKEKGTPLARWIIKNNPEEIAKKAEDPEFVKQVNEAVNNPERIKAFKRSVEADRERGFLKGTEEIGGPPPITKNDILNTIRFEIPHLLSTH